MIKCKYLDHGKSAPKEYGAYCTKLGGDKFIPLYETSCDECNYFEPEITDVDSFIASYFIDELHAENFHEFTGPKLRKLLSACWDAAIATRSR